jgi:hypothetical protein
MGCIDDGSRDLVLLEENAQASCNKLEAAAFKKYIVST